MIRADVVSGPLTEGDYEVYNIIIKEVFKGLSKGPQEKAFGVLGTELKTKLYTPSRHISSRVTGPFGIKKGVEYFMYGDIIHGGRLYTQFSDLRGVWNNETSRQKANLRGYYEAGCRQCQFRPCSVSDPECRKKLPGCETKAGELSYSWKSICWRRFEKCEVDETGQRCHWKETKESTECKNSDNPAKWFVTRDDTYH